MMPEVAILCVGILFLLATMLAGYCFSLACHKLLGIRKELEKDND